MAKLTSRPALRPCPLDGAGDRIAAARTEGALLVVRTLEHFLNNQLAITVGYAQLLAADPALLPRQRDMARLAAQGALDAATTLRRFGSLTRLVETDVGDGRRLLDVDRSTA